MIDWHSHVLPGMDDGSRNTAESIAMLREQAAQGVTTVIATPHFYANDESVATFLQRRSRAMEKLCEQRQAGDGMPSVRPGAEVRYYPGISRLACLSDLCIEGSKLLLLEMPFIRWTESMVRELIELSGKDGICLVLAHIDRYLALQSKGTWNRLLDNGVLMQVNASFFSILRTRRRAVSLLRGGYIHLLGSDCHNMTSRPPRLRGAVDVIQKRFGTDYMQQINEYGYSLFDIHHKQS